MKKFLCVIMTVALAAVLAVSVFAAAGDNLALTATYDAPFCSSWEDPSAINNGFYPAVTFTTEDVHYGSWGSTIENTETVSYKWDSEVTVDSIGLFFWHDQDDRAVWLANGGINHPASYTVQYWNGSEYVDVANGNGFGIDSDKMNVTTFDAVTTTSIQVTFSRLTDAEIEEYGASEGHGIGIYEFEVYEAGAEAAPQTGFATVAIVVAALGAGYVACKKH